MKSLIPQEVEELLGHYVYALVDPSTERIFYVGKGQRERAVSHEIAALESSIESQQRSRKEEIICKLAEAGQLPRVDILAHGLAADVDAFRIEAAVIDALGLIDLTNIVRGSNSRLHGRVQLSEFIAKHAKPLAAAPVSLLLIRINRLYRPGMDAMPLYEATRGVWRISKKTRETFKFAAAVFKGVIREVYHIEKWAPAGLVPYSTRTEESTKIAGKWEFVGRPAPAEIQNLLNGFSVTHLYKKGDQGPIKKLIGVITKLPTGVNH